MSDRKNAGLPNPEIARLVRMKAQKLRTYPEFKNEELADIEQDLNLKWLESEAQYNPKRASLVTYADVVLNNHIRNMLNFRRAQQRNESMNICSLDDPIDNRDEEGRTLRDVYSQDEYFERTGKRSRPIIELRELHIDVDQALARLSPRHRELARRLMYQTKSDAACCMGISRPTLYEWLNHIREVFLELGLDEYL